MSENSTTTSTLGWYIDREYQDVSDIGLPSRVGWGQTIEQARTMAVSMRNSVEIDTGLDARKDEIKEPVRFRVLDEDGNVYYGGVVERSWVEGDNEDGEDYAYFILKFGEADVGATDVQFRARELPEESVAKSREHNCVVKWGDEEWVIVYG